MSMFNHKLVQHAFSEFPAWPIFVVNLSDSIPSDSAVVMFIFAGFQCYLRDSPPANEASYMYIAYIACSIAHQNWIHIHCV